MEQASHRSCSQIFAPYSQDSATGFMPRSGRTKKGFNDVLSLPNDSTTTTLGGIRTEDTTGGQRPTSTNVAEYGSDTGDNTVRSLPPDLAYLKLHELLFNRARRSTPSESLTGRPNTGGDPALPDASHSVSSMDMAGLRMEMQNLRQVVQDIQAERYQPPPEYVV